jgi:hypothetical protein
MNTQKEADIILELVFASYMNLPRLIEKKKFPQRIYNFLIVLY